MTPEDLRRVVVVEELDLSADGRTAIVVRRMIKGNRYLGHLYAIDLASDSRTPRPRRLTEGTVRDTKPSICPDGRTVAFVRSDPADDDSVAAIFLLDLDRPGKIWPAKVGRHGGVGEIAWSPDGNRLAFTAEVDPPRFLVGKTRPISRRGKAPKDDGPTARHITRTDWRWDEEGHLDRWAHLFVIDMPSEAPRQATSGDWGVADIAWHPDSRQVAFASDRGPEPDLHPRTTIWSVDAGAHGGGTKPREPREILAPGGWANRPAWSPDGRLMAAAGVLEPEPFDDVSPGVILGPADGSGPVRHLAPDLDRPVGSWVDTDLTGWFVHGRHGPAWLDDGRIVATISDRGRSHPYVFSIDPATGAPSRCEPAAGGDVVTHTIAVGDRTIAALGTNGTRAMELMTIDDGEWGTRSTFGSRWQDAFEMPDMRLVQAPGDGGPIDVWIASPPGVGDRRLPAVVDVHGGPLGAWAPAPHLEVILLTARGYRVVLPNIRGSGSYGADWIRPQLGDWGGVDAADVHAAVDHVVDLGVVDPKRLGVMGLSYGGFMVNWLVGTTDRFKAAVSENGVTNQIASWANSDSGPEYVRAARMGDVFSPEGIDKLWRQSPLRNVANVRTPLLMLQAEEDRRCPAGDNEQFFVALRQLGRTVEYVLYPDEFHVYAAAGRPDRRIDRMTRVLDWFDRYLR
jgi:dipeptidyl aminopeptidase/acylaminoacyl peptidase